MVVLWEKSQKKSSICNIFNKKQDKERERERKRAKDLNVKGGKKNSIVDCKCVKNKNYNRFTFSNRGSIPFCGKNGILKIKKRNVFSPMSAQ